ncbi:glycosyltransferase [Lichenifustis flavocetrariae]|uniref:Glycosyltransferase n=1 Tax=Lichenifustis flavocetrariae TaxID=2949735 RepID=A0AA41Z5J7_9HYPH|nr:glycosyltransferase [Lichenifustis flavocetrariae]MCW6510898.1 glycosyltransferase [Lichenifustis flavocetrariae]
MTSSVETWFRQTVKRSASAALIVAIPANNEADRIEACLAALAMQRDHYGAPLAEGSFEVLLFANNCSDTTVELANAIAAAVPYRLHVIEETLSPEMSNAGRARKRAMDLAAEHLERAEVPYGAILTTDADSRVGPTWVSATREALAKGVDCVAGYIDADPAEIIRLGSDFLKRGRLEDRYLRLIAEIEARGDPRPHDPWPNHRVSSGASLAVSLAAYRAIGGLPPLALGEDAALTRRLEASGFLVRHTMEVHVTTSCRFDGRAAGGAADTMRFRHENQDAPCDASFEPALAATRRALIKGRLRRRWGLQPSFSQVGQMLALTDGILNTMAVSHRASGFDDFWEAVEALSPVLQRRHELRPSGLPNEIRRAEQVLRALKANFEPPKARETIDVPQRNHVSRSTFAPDLDAQVGDLQSGEGIIRLRTPMAQGDLAAGHQTPETAGNDIGEIFG